MENTYTSILALLKKNKIKTYDAYVATACDEAWNRMKNKKIIDNEPFITYDMFCNTCENLWLDCEDDTGLTAIADMVAGYYANTKTFPEEITDIL